MRCAERMRRSLGPNYQEPNAIQQTGGLWWCRALPPCARAPLWECVSGNFPSLKAPGTCSFPPFVYMWEWRSGAKKLPSWRCKIKGKGRWKRATRSAAVEQLLAALSFRTRPRETLSTLIYFIFHFSDRGAKIVPVFLADRSPTCCCCYFSSRLQSN